MCIKMFNVWSIPDESDLSDIRDTLVKNGMFNTDKSGNDKENMEYEKDEIILHNKNISEMIEYDRVQSLNEAFPDGY